MCCGVWLALPYWEEMEEKKKKKKLCLKKVHVYVRNDAIGGLRNDGEIW